jgi:hypothetical protein
MAEIKIRGDVSGSTTIKAPDSGSDEIIELSSALASKVNYPSGGANGNALIKDGTSAVWGAVAAGKILQIVRATDTTNRTTTSGTYVDASISVTITPQKSDSAVILAFLAQGATSWASGDEGRGAFQITDSSNNAISGVEDTVIGTENLSGTGTRQTRFPIHMWAYATPATTSAKTYKVRFRIGGGTVTMTLQNQFTTAQLFAIEVSA